MTSIDPTILSAAIVTSPYSGSGGSLFAWETHIACRRYRIDAILATFDRNHRYPDIGGDLRRIPESGTDRTSMGRAFRRIVNEARSEGKFLIVDLPGNSGDVAGIRAALTDGGLAESSNIACLAPLIPGQPVTWGAALGADSIRRTGIVFNRGLFRFWDHQPRRCRPDFPEFPNFPFWVASTLSFGAIAAIHRDPPCNALATEDLLPGFSALRMSGSPIITGPWVTQEISDHLEEASSAIYQAILAPGFVPSAAA